MKSFNKPPDGYHLNEFEQRMLHAIQKLEAENDKLMKIISDHPTAMKLFLKGERCTILGAS